MQCYVLRSAALRDTSSSKRRTEFIADLRLLVAKDTTGRSAQTTTDRGPGPRFTSAEAVPPPGRMLGGTRAPGKDRRVVRRGPRKDAKQVSWVAEGSEQALGIFEFGCLFFFAHVCGSRVKSCEL